MTEDFEEIKKDALEIIESYEKVDLNLEELK